ncbi:MAG: glycosyltransferase family 2 protein [Cyanobacteria bacterium J06598_3]
MTLVQMALAQVDLTQLLARLGFESVWDPQLGVLAVIAVSWIANADFHRRFRASIRSAPRLDPLDEVPEQLPSVSVIIPVYNEAVNVTECLKAVLANVLPEGAQLQVIVADDESTDETKALAEQVADERTLVFTVPPRPSDRSWRGKNWACAQAVEQATGDYLLFVDADVRLKPQAIARSLANAQTYQTDLLSCAPKIVCGCWAEWLVQPLMALLIAVGFSFEGVNNPAEPNKSAAAGPFMLFRRDAYDQVGGHEAVATNPVEDFALAHEIKSRGLKLRYVLGLDIADVQMYRSFAGLWEGWTKNFHIAGGRNIALTFFAAVAIALLFVVPWLGLLTGVIALWLGASHGGWMVLFAMVAIALQLYMRLSANSVVVQPVKYLWLGWLGGGLISAIALTSLWKTETGWGWTWRGRPLG